LTTYPPNVLPQTPKHHRKGLLGSGTMQANCKWQITMKQMSSLLCWVWYLFLRP